MRAGELDAFFDDSEVEIVDLDRVENSGSRKKWTAIYLTRRQRGFGTVFTGIVFVLTLGLLLAHTSGVSSLVWSSVFRATPPTPQKRVPFYLTGNPSWGRFAINSELVAHNPVIGEDQPLTLPPGTYTVIWQVAPFKPQNCTLNVSESYTLRTSRTCMLRSTFHSGLLAQVPVISFFASLDDLSASQRDAVMQQSQNTIAESTENAIVQAGEFYAISRQEALGSPAFCQTTSPVALCYAQAKRPLLATLHLQLDFRASPVDQCMVLRFCQQPAQDCRAFCENPAVSLAARGWNVRAIARSYWTYTPLNGQMSTQDQPASFVRNTSADQLFSLYLTLDQQGWHVMPFAAPGMADSPDDNPVCIQAQNDMRWMTNPFSLDKQLVSVQTLTDSAASPADGCLMILKRGPKVIDSPVIPLTVSNSSLTTAYCLERFGVLLAVNDMAHRFWPYLPVANAQEEHLAELLELVVK